MSAYPKALFFIGSMILGLLPAYAAKECDDASYTQNEQTACFNRSAQATAKKIFDVVYAKCRAKEGNNFEASICADVNMFYILQHAKAVGVRK